MNVFPMLSFWCSFKNHLHLSFWFISSLCLCIMWSQSQCSLFFHMAIQLTQHHLLTRPSFLSPVFHSVSVLVSCGYYNAFPQAWWLKTTREIYSLTVLEARNTKSVSLGWNQGVGRAVLPPEVLGENPFFASSSFWWLQAFLFIATSLQSLPPSWNHLLLGVCNLPLPLSYKDTRDGI